MNGPIQGLMQDDFPLTLQHARRRMRDCHPSAQVSTMTPDGVVRAYYPSGCRKTEAHLSNGNVLDQKNWPDGDKRSQAPDKSR